jgi:hypothetical protein
MSSSREPVEIGHIVCTGRRQRDRDPRGHLGAVQRQQSVADALVDRALPREDPDLPGDRDGCMRVIESQEVATVLHLMSQLTDGDNDESTTNDDQADPLRLVGPTERRT